MSKPFEVGAYVHQRLNLVANGKAHGRNAKAFKPDLGNSAVRHYRGAFENVAMVEMRTQLAIERAGLVTLHLQPARRSSIATIAKTVQLGDSAAGLRRTGIEWSTFMLVAARGGKIIKGIQDVF